jgi:hypothetical protein
MIAKIRGGSWASLCDVILCTRHTSIQLCLETPGLHGQSIVEKVYDQHSAKVAIETIKLRSKPTNKSPAFPCIRANSRAYRLIAPQKGCRMHQFASKPRQLACKTRPSRSIRPSLSVLPTMTSMSHPTAQLHLSQCPSARPSCSALQTRVHLSHRDRVLQHGSPWTTGGPWPIL